MGRSTMATSVKEMLLREVEGLSEQDAREVLELLKSKRASGVGPDRPALTRAELIKRAGGHPGIHVPDLNAPPFEEFDPVPCPGIPASELLVSDRR
jgi:hypothetical protein